jgi:hypothetical protein
MSRPITQARHVPAITGGAALFGRPDVVSDAALAMPTSFSFFEAA